MELTPSKMMLVGTKSKHTIRARPRTIHPKQSHGPGPHQEPKPNPTLVCLNQRHHQFQSCVENDRTDKGKGEKKKRGRGREKRGEGGEGNKEGPGEEKEGRLP